MDRKYFVAEVKEDKMGIYPSRNISYHYTLEEASQAARLEQRNSLWQIEVFYLSGTQSLLCIWDKEESDVSYAND